MARLLGDFASLVFLVWLLCEEDGIEVKPDYFCARTLYSCVFLNESDELRAQIPVDPLEGVKPTGGRILGLRSRCVPVIKLIYKLTGRITYGPVRYNSRMFYAFHDYRLCGSGF